MISNPENDFNKSNLGVHTLGLVPISEIKPLNDLGYRNNSWNGIYVYHDASWNNYLTDTKISLRLLSSKDKDTLFFELSKINKVITVNLILKNVLTKFILWNKFLVIT